MEEKITIGIAEDNEIILETLSEIVTSEEEFQLVGVAQTGQKAMELLREKKPAVMLLDVVMPAGGGLDVLAMAKEEKLETKFVMISAIGDEKITQEAFSMGANYYIMKPFEAKSVIRGIRLALQGNAKADVKVTEKITKLLQALGVPAQLNGYSYLREAICLVVENPEEITAVTKQIYPAIAKKHGASAASVERAIRHAIEVSWTRGNVEEMDRIFGYTISNDKGKPTNSEYIAMIADHIRMENDML